MKPKSFHDALQRESSEFLNYAPTAVFTSVEKKVGFFLDYSSTTVSFLLALRLAHMGATLAFD